jgi:hypothetical protein
MEVDPKEDIWWNQRSSKNDLLNKCGKQFDHVESRLSDPTYASVINKYAKDEGKLRRSRVNTSFSY